MRLAGSGQLRGTKQASDMVSAEWELLV